MSLMCRISNLFSRAKVDREIDAELRSHIEMRIEDNVAAGMSADEARRDALVRFGNRAATKEKVAGMDAVLVLDSIWSDLRFALRQLARNPGFAFTAIVVLALGMGASVAIFAFVNAALVRPLSYSDPSDGPHHCYIRRDDYEPGNEGLDVGLYAPVLCMAGGRLRWAGAALERGWALWSHCVLR